MGEGTAPSCPCGHLLVEEFRTLRLIPEGEEPFQLNEVVVLVCPNCQQMISAPVSHDRIARALGLAPGDPWPRCRVFTESPARTDLTGRGGEA